MPEIILENVTKKFDKFVAVDNLCRNLLAVEIPIGILTSFFGAPFFLALMLKKEASL